MNIYNYLKKEHKKVSQMLDQVLITKDEDKRLELLDKISYELLLHAKNEEDTFYKALENEEITEERIEEAKKEHNEIEKYLEELSELELDTKEWMEKFEEFKHSVTHHIEEEEGEIFRKAKEVLSDSRAEELAEEMDELKKSPKYQKKAQT